MEIPDFIDSDSVLDIHWQSPAFISQVLVISQRTQEKMTLSLPNTGDSF